MQNLFKEYRADLHRHYRQYESPEEARANPPPRLKEDIEDWHFLCTKFETPEWKKLAEANRNNRSALSFNHRAGSKSFLQIREDMKLEQGCEIGPIDLFERTHSRNGEWVTQKANDAHNQMLVLQDAPVPEGSEPLAGEEILEKVLGKRPGHVKGLGWGPKPTSRNKTSSDEASSQREREQATQIESLQAQLQESEAKIHKVEAMVEEERSATLETKAELENLRGMIQQFMQSQGGETSK